MLGYTEDFDERNNHISMYMISKTDFESTNFLAKFFGECCVSSATSSGCSYFLRFWLFVGMSLQEKGFDSWPVNQFKF